MLYYNKRNIKFSIQSETYFHYIDRPSLNELIRKDWLIKILWQSGIFSQLDGLWCFANEVSQNGIINIINPSADACDISSNPTFTQFEGFTGDGASKYINTFHGPSSDGTNYTLNNAALFVYIRTNTSGDTKCDMGCTKTGSDENFIYTRKAANTFASITNRDFAADYTATNSDSKGFYHVQRVAGDAEKVYKNGSGMSGNPFTSIPTGVTDKDLYILALNDADTATEFSDRQISFAGIGSGNISPGPISDIINGYMTLINKNVY